MPFYALFHAIWAFIASTLISNVSIQFTLNVFFTKFCRLFTSNSFRKSQNRKLEKLKCFINYFRRITMSEDFTNGCLSFERKQADINFDELPNCALKVSPFDLNTNGCMFMDGLDLSQVDFAHKFIGGGVLNNGCVQEEILFVICPELVVSKLFCSGMLDNESLVITGAEQFNTYSGYSDSFTWKENWVDVLPRDKYQRLCRQIIAIDATFFKSRSSSQYTKSMIDRELKKAFCGFQPDSFVINQSRQPTIATGNWGCGVYRGDPYLKMLIQLVAVSMCQRNFVYFTFHDQELASRFEQLRGILSLQTGLTVGRLYQILSQFGSEKLVNAKTDLLDFVKQKLVWKYKFVVRLRIGRCR